MTLNKEDIHKELDLVQDCIARMAGNSFSMKGWHIGIISALFAFFFNKDTINVNIILFIIAAVTLAFWYLDSYYLMIERKYRWKYAWIIENRVNKEKPSTDFLFDLNPDNVRMWKANKASKGYKAAERTQKAFAYNRNGFIQSWYRLMEVADVMISNTMEVEYLIVFVFSLLISILRTFMC